ncbi:MAG: translocation/assembly module TamB domain-containing protein [Chlamydiota bacterium]
MNTGTNPNPANSTGKRNRILLPATVGILILAAFLAAAWYLTSPRFQQLVRARVIAQLQRSTGGRVELGAFQWNLSRLQFEARNLTIHGREGPGELPFFHADRVLVRMRIASVLRERVVLSYLGVERPVIHVVSYPDGTTNQPQPAIQDHGAQSTVEELFRLAVQRLDVQQGALLLNDRRIPLDLTADDVVAGMNYALGPPRYEGKVHVGKLDTRFNGMRPFASTASAEFTLWRTSAEVKSLTWTSGSSHFSAQGHLDNFRQPTITASYQGIVDLQEMGKILRRYEWHGGSATVEGHASYEAGNYLALGRVAATSLDLSTPSGVLRRANLAGEYSWSNGRFKLSNLSGRALAGKVSGDLEIVRQVEPTVQARHHRPLPSLIEERGVVHLQLEGISLAQLADSVSTRSFPLGRLGVTGTATGSMKGTWRGSPGDVEAQLDFRLSAPSQPQPGQLPLNGRVQGAYSGSRHLLTFSQLTLASPASSLAANGTLGSSSANLNLGLATSNLGELQPILAAFRGPRHIPLIVHGKAAFDGTVAGRISAPTFIGHLQVTNFDTALHVAGQEPSPANAGRQIHWDLLSAEVQLSPSNLVLHHGVLRRGTAEMTFAGELGLKKYRPAPESPLAAQLRLQRGELADMVAMAGYNYPLSGQVDATLRAWGTWHSPHAQGPIQVSRPAFAGTQFNSLTAELHLAGSQARLENLVLTRGPAKITGGAGYDFRTIQFQFNLQGGEFDLAKFTSLQSSRLQIAGQMEFSVQGSGTRQAPVINGTLRLRRLVFDTEPLGDFTLTASTHDAVTRLAGRSQFGKASLDLDGDLRLHGDLPTQVTLRFSRLDVDPLLTAYLRGRLTGHSSSAGTITVSGPLLRPRDLQVRGDVAEFRADIENLKIQNSGPLQFALAQRTLTLQRFHLSGDGTDFEATGSAQFAPSGVLNLRANGNINLKIVQTLNPDYLSSGVMTVALSVAGTMAAPDLRGRVQISDGSISNIDLPSGLSNINGTLVFNQDRLRVQKLTAQTGGGLLNLGGFITYNRNLNFDLTAEGKDIRLRYPPGMSTTANVNLHLVGALARSTLSGDILVTRFQLARNFDFASYLARARGASSLPNPQSPLNNLRLDVHITTTPELDVQTAIARVAGDADLRVRGSAAKPVVLGRVDIARGDVNFSGTRYHLERGDITFSNPVRIEPVLDLEASARVRDYDITLGFHGTIDKLNATYSSEPPLPTADIIALLAMGRTREESAIIQQQSETSYTRTASNAILGEALNAANSNRLEKIFGVSRVKIDPEAGGAENNPNWTRVTIEQQISNTLTLTYITNVSQAQEQIIQAEYYLTRNISLIALRDQNGVVSFDISIRHRRK